MSVGTMPNAEWESMEERAHRCRRIAAVIRYDLERQALPAETRDRAQATARRNEEAADRITAQLKAARGY